jgi:hypothetical protein
MKTDPKLNNPIPEGLVEHQQAVEYLRERLPDHVQLHAPEIPISEVIDESGQFPSHWKVIQALKERGFNADEDNPVIGNFYRCAERLTNGMPIRDRHPKSTLSYLVHYLTAQGIDKPVDDFYEALHFYFMPGYADLTYFMYKGYSLGLSRIYSIGMVYRPDDLERYVPTEKESRDKVLRLLEGKISDPKRFELLVQKARGSTAKDRFYEEYQIAASRDKAAEFLLSNLKEVWLVKWVDDLPKAE